MGLKGGMKIQFRSHCLSFCVALLLPVCQRSLLSSFAVCLLQHGIKVYCEQGVNFKDALKRTYKEVYTALVKKGRNETAEKKVMENVQQRVCGGLGGSAGNEWTDSRFASFQWLFQFHVGFDVSDSEQIKSGNGSVIVALRVTSEAAVRTRCVQSVPDVALC